MGNDERKRSNTVLPVKIRNRQQDSGQFKEK